MIKSVIRFASALAGVGLLTSLLGCDLVEESTTKLAAKTAVVVQGMAQETLGQVVQDLNKAVDGVQASTQELLEQPKTDEQREEAHQSSLN